MSKSTSYQEFKVSARQVNHDFELKQYSIKYNVASLYPKNENSIHYLQEQLDFIVEKANEVEAMFWHCHGEAQKILFKQHPLRYFFVIRTGVKRVKVVWIKKVVRGNPGLSTYKIDHEVISERQARKFTRAFEWEKEIYYHFSSLFKPLLEKQKEFLKLKKLHFKSSNCL